MAQARARVDQSTVTSTCHWCADPLRPLLRWMKTALDEQARRARHAPSREEERNTKRRISCQHYNQTEKGKLRNSKYNQTDKGEEKLARYDATTQGKLRYPKYNATSRRTSTEKSDRVKVLDLRGAAASAAWQ